MKHKIEPDWKNASWRESRRAMIRQSLRLSVRERLQALEELEKTARKLAAMEIRRSAKDGK